VFVVVVVVVDDDDDDDDVDDDDDNVDVSLPSLETVHSLSSPSSLCPLSHFCLPCTHHNSSLFANWMMIHRVSLSLSRATLPTLVLHLPMVILSRLSGLARL
jgi:hypothetical protein